MSERHSQFSSDSGSRNESTLESFRRLDVYPTAQRICSSSHHTSPEKSSPRQLRKQIFISEEKMRKSASRSPQSSEYGDKNIRCRTFPSSPAEDVCPVMEPFDFRSESSSIGFTVYERLEILSRTPVRALRPSAGSSFMEVDDKLYEGSIDQLRMSETVDVLIGTTGAGPRSRSDTITSTLSCLSSDF